MSAFFPFSTDIIIQYRRPVKAVVPNPFSAPRISLVQVTCIRKHNKVHHIYFNVYIYNVNMIILLYDVCSLKNYWYSLKKLSFLLYIYIF